MTAAYQAAFSPTISIDSDGEVAVDWADSLVSVIDCWTLDEVDIATLPPLADGISLMVDRIIRRQGIPGLLRALAAQLEEQDARP